MIKNYLKIGLRSLSRNRSYTFLNILGLSIGVAACILLYVVISYERSFDNFHAKKDRIYRVVRNVKGKDGNSNFSPGNPLPAIAALEVDVPQFEKIVPVFGTIDPQITVLGKDANSLSNEKKFLETNTGMVVGPEFFDLFDFKWLQGNAKVLAEPNIIVLSRKKAENYFGKWEDAVGQYLKINNKAVVKVAGVLDDIPLNTDFPLDIVVSYETKRKNPDLLMFGFGRFDSWGTVSSNDQIFVLLPENASEKQFNGYLQQFADKHQDGEARGTKVFNFLSPLADQHHDERFENYSEHRVNKSVLVTLSLIAALIILMACINFINLATAQSVSRSKEVGVRKALGSLRWQLVGQFMTETVLIVFSAVVLGVLIALLSLPLLSRISQVPADLPILLNPQIWLFISVLLVFVSFMAGFYPSMVVSGFQPIEALKNKISGKTIGGISLRKALIVTQFAISQVLIIGTIVTVSQMNFIQKLDLGFIKEGVYIVPLDSEYSGRFESFKHELMKNPAIRSVSFSSDQPSSDNNWSSNFAFDNRAEDADFSVSLKMADPDYFKTYGLEFLAGEADKPSDTTRGYVVNETLLHSFGLKDPQKAIGKNIKLGGGQWKPIVGVVKDFKANSAREAAKPIIIMQKKDYYWQLAIKLGSSNLTQSVEDIRKQYDASFPEVVFTGSFFDENIENFYQQEQQMTLLYQIFAGLTIFIACLGLFGLATFTARQRTKEIGIRKVLGASVLNLSALLSADFVKLVLAAILIAGPVAYYLMGKWLQDFENKISISWWMFVLAGLISVAIALITVSFQSVKAALMNPVKSLKSE